MSLVAAAAAMAACSPRWQRVDPAAARLNPRSRVQIFSGTRTFDLHGVAFSTEVVSGVPFFQPLACDSCRVVVARGAVDSVRVISPKDDMPFYMGLGTVLALYFMFSLCQPGGCVPGR